MAVSLLETTATCDLLKELTGRSATIWIASAWAALDAPLIPELRKAVTEDRVKALVVGLDFAGTDPQFLREFQQIVSVPRKRAGYTFHPKVYLFLSEGRFDAIIGSSNLTNGGLVNNIEFNTCVSGSESEAIFGSILAFIEKTVDGGSRLDEAEILAYESEWDRRGAARQNLNSPPPSGLENKPASMRTSPSFGPGLDWEQYITELRRIDEATGAVFPHGSGRSYVEVIRDIGQYFTRHGRLASMPASDRKSVCGTVSGSRFAQFGSTQGAGTFTHLVKAEPAALDRALDIIPFSREVVVSRSSFNAFVEAFADATAHLSVRPGVPCWSRILAMKRPDYFVCVNRRNADRLANSFGVSRKSIWTSPGYWRLHERLWASPWFKAPRPIEGSELEVWNARVAILDAIHYVEVP